jgi:hypothetical protein
VPEAHGLGTGPGSGHVRDAAKAHFHYNQSISRGIFGADIARFSEGSTFGGDDPVSRSLSAVSRFCRR